MNQFILNTDAQKFINNNLEADITSLLLKGITFNGITAREIVEQIEVKKKCNTKLPTWFKAENIYYPNKLNIEQTSSEITAQYKSQLLSGSSIIDITGGFGVDCYYFSKRFNHVTHCEINEALSEIVSHNYKQMETTNIKTINTDGISYLKDSKQQFDWIYADPSRRHDSKGKVFFLNDCLPNIPEHLELLFESSKNIMIKTSPLLDLSVGIGELKHVKTIVVVAVNNEVKELLWLLEYGFDGQASIKTFNLRKDKNQHFSFSFNDENTPEATYSLPLTYLYEPNAAILKAGAFNAVAKQFGLNKLHKHSHLYTSNQLIDFPGRCFKIESVLPYNKKQFKKEFVGSNANITTRNFPETVQKIRKKLNIKDGGDSYLFFTTDMMDEKIVIVTHKT